MLSNSPGGSTCNRHAWFHFMPFVYRMRVRPWLVHRPWRDLERCVRVAASMESDVRQTWRSNVVESSSVDDAHKHAHMAAQAVNFSHLQKTFLLFWPTLLQRMGHNHGCKVGVQGVRCGDVCPLPTIHCHICQKLGRPVPMLVAPTATYRDVIVYTVVTVYTVYTRTKKKKSLHKQLRNSLTSFGNNGI